MKPPYISPNLPDLICSDLPSRAKGTHGLVLPAVPAGTLGQTGPRLVPHLPHLDVREVAK